MDKKQKDRHLDVPAEANRDKDINFLAEERKETDPAKQRSENLIRDRKQSKKAEKNQ